MIRYQFYSTQIFPVSMVFNHKSSTQPEQKCRGTVFESVEEQSRKLMSGEPSYHEMS